ncbi:unnamed protein product, partial [Rotaria sp. Silwood1]
DMNKHISISHDICRKLLSNIVEFMKYIPIDSSIQLWINFYSKN